MMDGHEKAVYPDMSEHRNDVSMEVNWNQNTGDTVRITIGDKTAVIPYVSLYGFVFMNAEGEALSDLMPVKQTVVRKIRKQHHVIVKRSVVKGDRIVVNCEIDVPIAIVQALKGDMGRTKFDISPGRIVVPV